MTGLAIDLVRASSFGVVASSVPRLALLQTPGRCTTLCTYQPRGSDVPGVTPVSMLRWAPGVH